MTTAEVIAALTAAIDHPDPSSPSTTVPGTATQSDQPFAADYLRSVVRAVAAVASASTSVADFAAAHAAWRAKHDAAFADLDRSVRAVETLVLRLGPDASITPAIHLDASDPNKLKSRINNVATRLSVSARARQSLQITLSTYTNLLTSEPPSSSAAAVSAAQAALNSTLADASAYLDYLAAVA